MHFPLDLLDLQLNPKQFLLHLLLELLPPLEPKQLLMHLMPLLPTLDLLQDLLLSLKLLPLVPLATLDFLLKLLPLRSNVGLEVPPRLLPPLPLGLLPRQLPGTPSTSSASMMRTRTQGPRRPHQTFP